MDATSHSTIVNPVKLTKQTHQIILRPTAWNVTMDLSRRRVVIKLHHLNPLESQVDRGIKIFMTQILYPKAQAIISLMYSMHDPNRYLDF
jgi:hypothetical protein